MPLTNMLIFFGLFIIFLGFGLMIYLELFNLMLRFHMKFYPKLEKHYDRLFKELHETDRPDQEEQASPCKVAQ
ncbi:MAG: hypothetical protein AB7U29_15135 [Desulfobulbus sp.]